MPEAISPKTLSSSDEDRVLIDVRKRPARAAAAETIPGSVYRSPFSADQWWREFEGRAVAVFCVHGHEVSRAVCGFLGDQGIDARYLEGGFAAWKSTGLPVAAISEG